MALQVTDEMVLKGYEQLTGFAAAKALQSVPDGATVAYLLAEDQNIRWRDDGTSPTISVGMILKANAEQPFKYIGSKTGLNALEFIEETTTAILDVAYYGPK